MYKKIKNAILYATWTCVAVQTIMGFTMLIRETIKILRDRKKS